MYDVSAPEFHQESSKFLPKRRFHTFPLNTIKKPTRFTLVGTKSLGIDKQFHCLRNTVETPTRFAPLVSNDPLLESKVVTDEPGRLGRPAERVGRWPSLAGPGWPARPPGPACRPVGCSAGRGGEEGKAKEGGSAPAEPRPPTPITAGGLFSTELGPTEIGTGSMIYNFSDRPLFFRPTTFFQT